MSSPHQDLLERTIMDCWHREIDKSGTEADVVRNTSEFLALWSPRELAPLTLGWREVRVESADDIQRVKKWIFEDLDRTPEMAQLSELGDYFWHAASRIGEIRRSV
jgi:hypothetical protein